MTDLPSKARAVVIGGGAVGCSVAYHLAKLGWTDVVLLERKRLTSGTTWHAAGLIGQLRATFNLTRLAKYSAELYDGLEAETGIAIGYRRNGSLGLALSEHRLEEFARGASMASTFGLVAEMLPPEECARRHPLADMTGVKGGVFLPTDGHADPANIALALAKGARQRGVRIFEDVAVSGSSEVLSNWELIKAKERSKDGKPRGVLDGVPRSLPGLQRAQRIGEKVARVGFDWADRHGSRAKVTEELDELDRAIETGDAAQIEEELGDVLFVVAALARTRASPTADGSIVIVMVRDWPGFIVLRSHFTVPFWNVADGSDDRYRQPSGTDAVTVESSASHPPTLRTVIRYPRSRPRNIRLFASQLNASIGWRTTVVASSERAVTPVALDATALDA